MSAIFALLIAASMVVVFVAGYEIGRTDELLGRSFWPRRHRAPDELERVVTEALRDDPVFAEHYIAALKREIAKENP